MLALVDKRARAGFCSGAHGPCERAVRGRRERRRAWLGGAWSCQRLWPYGDDGVLSMSAYKTIIFVLLTNLATLLLSVSLDKSGFVDNSLKAHAEWFWVIPLAIIVLTYLVTATLDLREQYVRLGATVDRLKALPTSLIMTARRDEFTIFPDKSCQLDYHFTVDCDPQAAINALHFPIMSNINPDGSNDGRQVDVISVIVNRRPFLVKDVYEQRRKIFFLDLNDNAVPMRFGVVKAPINFEPGTRTYDVHIALRLIGTFDNIYDHEYVIVDVPYLTQSLEVAIRFDGGSIEQSQSGKSAIEAYSEFVDLYDDAESLRQLKNLSYEGEHKILWKCTYPNLAYRYRIWFRCEKKQP
jgi:hypothetical protein